MERVGSWPPAFLPLACQKDFAWTTPPPPFDATCAPAPSDRRPRSDFAVSLSLLLPNLVLSFFWAVFFSPRSFSLPLGSPVKACVLEERLAPYVAANARSDLWVPFPLQ